MQVRRTGYRSRPKPHSVQRERGGGHFQDSGKNDDLKSKGFPFFLILFTQKYFVFSQLSGKNFKFKFLIKRYSR